MTRRVLTWLALPALLLAATQGCAWDDDETVAMPFHGSHRGSL